jgi:hypothetical protein
MELSNLARPIALLSALVSFLFVSAPKQSGQLPLGSSKVCAIGCCRQLGSICWIDHEVFDAYTYFGGGTCPGS